MRISAEYLADVDVPVPRVGGGAPGECQGVAGHVSIQDHVVATVGPAQHRGLGPVLTGRELGCQALGPGVGDSTGPTGHCGHWLRDLECVEVESDLTDVS